jgi:hypothetical protein
MPLGAIPQSHFKFLTNTTVVLTSKVGVTVAPLDENLFAEPKINGNRTKLYISFSFVAMYNEVSNQEL